MLVGGVMAYKSIGGVGLQKIVEQLILIVEIFDIVEHMRVITENSRNSAT